MRDVEASEVPVDPITRAGREVELFSSDPVEELQHNLTSENTIGDCGDLALHLSLVVFLSIMLISCV